MSTTIHPSLSSHVRLGHARADITPPGDIYQRCWGAARHDQAEGIHRPLFADAWAVGPIDSTDLGFLRIQLDLVQLTREQDIRMVDAISHATGIPQDQILLSFSHTHAVSWFSLDRVDFPGGDKIPGYLDELERSLQEVSRQAVANMQETWITYATGRCNMAGNRDYWDDRLGGFVCGFDPAAPADDTVIVARLTDSAGELQGAIVNYACHPTTLAWENRLISPDFIGAMREEIERIAGASCCYFQGACGDLGPRYGFVGDAGIADKNGRWLAYAALAALESMGPPAADYHYKGHVVSGATLGVWEHRPFSPERRASAARFAGGLFTVELPLKPKPDPEALEVEKQEWLTRQQEADARGDAVAARDYGARAERARRWQERIKGFPEGDTYTFPYSVFRLGDAFWVTTTSEPYNWIQVELRRRFPDHVIIFSPVAGVDSVAYLLNEDSYGKGKYQEEPSLLDKGCLELLTTAVAERIESLR